MQNFEKKAEFYCRISQNFVDFEKMMLKNAILDAQICEDFAKKKEKEVRTFDKILKIFSGRVIFCHLEEVGEAG